MNPPNIDNKDINLFQQIGQIQGTLAALNTNISDFKTEFRTMTNDQNSKIEAVRKDLGSQIKEMSGKVETLEAFKANLEGAHEEARKNARNSGLAAGGGAGISIVAIIEIIKFIATHVKF